MTRPNDAPALVLLLIAALMLAAQARAQPEGEEERAIVGSYLPRLSWGSPAPVRIVERGALERGGFSTLGDALRAIPEQYPSPAGGGSPFIVPNGQAAVELRGVSRGGTLVLLNGRRLVPSARVLDGELVVDVNRIPLAGIERIEILKDGASGLYGSDAMAGVVNLVTRDHFRGFETKFRWHTTTQGDQEDREISLHGGLGAGRLRLTGTVSYLNRTGLEVTERRFADETGRDVLGFPATYAVLSGPLAGAQLADPDCEQGAYSERLVLVPGAAEFCTFDFRSFNQLFVDEERLDSLHRLEFDLTETTRLFAEGSLSWNEIEGIQPPSLPVVEGAFVPGTHPDNPFGGDLVFLGMPFGDGGRSRRREGGFVSRAAAGIQGRLGDLPGFPASGALFATLESWSFDLSGTWGRHRHRASFPDNRKGALQAALLCADPSFCFNPFYSAISGAGTANSASVRDAIAGKLRLRGTSDLYVADLLIRGDLFSGNKLTLSLATGGQYRRSDWTNTCNQDCQAGNLGFLGGFENRREGRDVAAVFGEMRTRWGEAVELQSSLRWESHSGVGDSINPKFAGRAMFFDNDWLTISALRELGFRASWGTSFRAPYLFQRSLGRGTDLVAVSDPLSSVPTQIRPFVVSGNTGLDSVRARSWGVGWFWQHKTQATLFQIQIDWWDITIRDLIVADVPQNILNNDPLDPRVVRDAFGQIVRIEATLENAGLLKTDGLDLGFAWSHDLEKGRLRPFAAGVLRSQLQANYLHELERGRNRGRVDAAGKSTTSPRPRWNAYWSFGWEVRQHELSGALRWVDAYRVPALGTRIGHHITTDLQYRYRFSSFLGGNTVAIAGVTNLLNNKPPHTNLGFDFDPFLHDPRGRLAYLELRHTR